MSGNETIFVDEAELIDLINETNAVVDKLNMNTVNEEYEKKCAKIFNELDKDLTNWAKHTKKYLEKLKQAHELEEGVKYNLLKRLDLGSINKETGLFETRLKQLENLLKENVKVSCGELIGNEELNQLRDLGDTVESIRDQFCDINEAFEGFTEDNKEAVQAVKIIQRTQTLLDHISGLETQLNKIQRKIVKSGAVKFSIDDI